MDRATGDRTAVRFRIVGPGDESNLTDLLGDIDPTFFRPHPFTPEEIERISAHAGRDVYGMLMDGDRPVAYGLLRGLDEGYATPSLGIAVRTDAQGRGFARLTMTALHAEARARGAAGVRLRVHSDNTRARRLYESLGYAYRGEDRGELVMGLDLPPQRAPDVGAFPDRRRAPMRRIGFAVKRLLDVTGAAGGLIVLSPVLAWVGLALVVTQGRPVFFRHRRPGREGRLFTLVKFRTMRHPQPGEARYLTDDVRVTRLGRFLRSTSIDELPELWNVLRGEMSLVGPRPLLEEYLDTYTSVERRRHDMRPGITSWAAVNGRHSTPFKERLELDVWYVEHWSLQLDLRIIGLTLRQLISRRDVSTTQDIAAIGFPLPGAGAATGHAAPSGPADRPDDFE